MIIDSLCPPAVLYLGFSVIQIIIDLFRGQQNSAFLKVIVMIVFTILLNQLCIGGLTILSWFIVFIPFILMTYVTTILLYVFGLTRPKGNMLRLTHAGGTNIVVIPVLPILKTWVDVPEPNSGVAPMA